MVLTCSSRRWVDSAKGMAAGPGSVPLALVVLNLFERIPRRIRAAVDTGKRGRISLRSVLGNGHGTDHVIGVAGERTLAAGRTSISRRQCALE
jgi:hypothetical protein